MWTTSKLGKDQTRRACEVTPSDRSAGFRYLCMSTRYLLRLVLCFTLSSASLKGQEQAFTYQGRLLDGGNPAMGIYDLQFSLWNFPKGGAMIGLPQTNTPVNISNGLFSVILDFGSGSFNGAARWLEIAVRTNGSLGPYTTLGPRQHLTATPYAVHANEVASGGLVSGVYNSA